MTQQLNLPHFLLAASFVAVAIQGGQAIGQAVQAVVNQGLLNAGVGLDGQPSPSFEEVFLNGREGSFFEQAIASSGGASANATIDTDVTIQNDSVTRYVLTGSHNTSSVIDEFDPNSTLGMTLSFNIDQPVEVTAFGFVEAGPSDRVTASFSLLGFNAVTGGANPRETFDASGLAPAALFTYDFEFSVVSGPSVFGASTAPGDVTYSFTFEFDPLSATRIWDNPSGGLYSVASNWASDEAPVSGDEIVFDLVSAGYVVQMDQNADVSNATVEQGTVSWRFNGNAGNMMSIANDLTVGTAPSVRGGLDVIGGTINVGDVNIGTTDNADALVTLRDGAVLDPIGNINVGGGANAEAQLFVISGSTLKLDEGENLTVTGTESSLTADALSIGTTNIGGGVMTVSQGAKLTVNGDLDILDSDLFIQNAGSVVTVAGSAQFTTGSRVTISDGGRLLPSDVFNEEGVLLINSTGLDESDVGVRVTGAESWFRGGAQEIAIGTLSNGEVEVLDGGELLTLGDVVLGGVGSETYGDLLVRGEGSVAFANSLQLFSAGDALSVLEVDAGAEVTLGNDVHANNSQVIISGAGSTLEMDNQFLIRGGADATLEVSDGGSLIVAAELEDVGVDGTTLIFDSIDPNSFPDGNVLIGGTSATNDSRIRTLGSIKIGHESDGYVLIASSSELATLGDVHLGNGENDTDGYLVVDENSEFVANRVIVGADEGGSGLFRVSDSAEASVGVLDVRRNGVVQTELDGSIVVGEIPDDYAGPRENYVVLGDGGELTGTGEVSALIEEAGGVNNWSGMVTPGNSPGMLTINGDYLQGEDGELVIEIAGKEAGATYDVLSVTGDAEIDGEVVFQFIDGFAPTAGDNYMFLETAGGADLSGAEFRIQGLMPGFEYLVDSEVPGGPFLLTALTDGVVLDPLAADFDEDGNVDGSDLIALQRNYGIASGAMRADGDADGNGAVDDVDLSIWEDQFGNVASTETASVPEPATWTMTLLLFVVVGGNARRQARAA